MSVLVSLLPFVLAGCAMMAVGMALVLWLCPNQQSRLRLPFDALGEPRVFRFRDGYLVSSDRGTGFLLPQPVNRMTAWDDLRKALADLVPGAATALQDLEQSGSGFRLETSLGRDRLLLIGLRDGPDLRISLSTGEESQAAIRVDSQILAALQAENLLLTRSHNASPGLVWVYDAEDRVIWANGPYQEEVVRCLGPEAAAVWPLPTLFPNRGTPPKGPVRRSLGSASEGIKERWYEVEICPELDGVRHAHAQPITRVIEAEEGLRRVIDTLTRTVTTLPVGLAVFDPTHQLVMFNPPFLDLTELDGAWLAGRPDLNAVFGALRDKQNRQPPEGWEDWVPDLGDGSAAFELPAWTETWTTGRGDAFRLTARCQPDGAIALLLEDITAEARLKDRSAAETALFDTILEESSDAIAAFSSEGRVTHLNARMDALMPKGHATPVTLDDVTTGLSSICRPSPLWKKLQNLSGGTIPDPGPEQTVSLLAGGALTIKISRSPEGFLVLHVRSHQAQDILPEKVSSVHAAARALLRSTKPSSQPRAG